MIAPDDLVTSSSRDRMILVVDDEPLLLDILGDELEDLGYHVLRALNGEEALSLVRDQSEHIDLLVTDIRLPGSIDGWSIAEEARRLRPDLPVIYVTGFFSQASREVPGGMMIMKPYRPSAIVTAARKLWAE
ncbi:response regulator [Lichenifustis flavocetrariae]|uniref:Response regulator n=1 Tax=Lichenifustis flavocetrariae TaxID=2949735 RepID=A0AA42CN94_9HYPH|nr:response regulator [Lichenifustis flavocetrariae]MCW6509182.1 response regulator [Lichenifustis flavocetrariae]